MNAKLTSALAVLALALCLVPAAAFAQVADAGQLQLQVDMPDAYVVTAQDGTVTTYRSLDEAVSSAPARAQISYNEGVTEGTIASNDTVLKASTVLRVNAGQTLRVTASAPKLFSAAYSRGYVWLSTATYLSSGAQVAPGAKLLLADGTQLLGPDSSAVMQVTAENAVYVNLAMHDRAIDFGGATAVVSGYPSVFPDGYTLRQSSGSLSITGTVRVNSVEVHGGDLTIGRAGKLDLLYGDLTMDEGRRVNVQGTLELRGATIAGQESNPGTFTYDNTEVHVQAGGTLVANDADVHLSNIYLEGTNAFLLSTSRDAGDRLFTDSGTPIEFPGRYYDGVQFDYAWALPGSSYSQTSADGTTSTGTIEADGTVTTRVESPDGEVRTTVTRPDGTSTINVTRDGYEMTEERAADGSLVRVEKVRGGDTTTTTVAADGSKTVVTRQPDGAELTVVYDADGNVTSSNGRSGDSDVTTQMNADGSSTLTIVDVYGSVGTVELNQNNRANRSTVKVSEAAISAAQKSSSAVELPLADGALRPTAFAKQAVFVVDAPAGTKVRVPLTSTATYSEPGTVVVQVATDGTRTPLMLSRVTSAYAEFVLPVAGGSYLVCNNATKFIDVTTDLWYRPYAAEVSARGIMEGTLDGRTQLMYFNGDKLTTRAQFAQVLWNMEGRPSAGAGARSFSDVPASAWFYPAVTWAASVGVVRGNSATTFNPQGSLTREQVALMLYRYAKYKEYKLAAPDNMTSFADTNQIKYGAEGNEALAWAVGEGVITGAGEGGYLLAPRLETPRKQLATMLTRFVSSPMIASQ